MEFEHFLSKLSKIRLILQDYNYNGQEFQNIMTPKERLNFDVTTIENPKKAAVLALIYPKNKQTYLLLTLRANYKGVHAAQVSFPGGKKEKSDNNLIETAFRETEEEIGVYIKDSKEIFKLTELYIPPSNFLVSPFMTVLDKEPIFKPNYEVEEVIEISLNDLLNDDNIYLKNRTTSYASLKDVPCFELNNFVIWGATAMILSELKKLLKLSLI